MPQMLEFSGFAEKKRQCGLEFHSASSHRSQLPIAIRLPDFVGVYVERGQPASAAAICVDALQIAQIENLARRLM